MIKDEKDDGRCRGPRANINQEHFDEYKIESQNDEADYEQEAVGELPFEELLYHEIIFEFEILHYSSYLIKESNKGRIIHIIFSMKRIIKKLIRIEKNI